VRIGIFGGTFNPIHLGHLRSAEEVREAQGLDAVLFVPSANPPHKRGVDIAPARHRLAMVRLALAGNPAFRSSSIEIERPGRSYSVETLSALRQRQPRVRFAFILGIDAFREIAAWRQYRRLFELCDMIVTSRPSYPFRTLVSLIPVAARKDFCYPHRRDVLEHRSGYHVRFQSIRDLAISASDVRERLRHGTSIRYLVSQSVERYIERHGLYGHGRRRAPH
jgi:nicotinate-nucleotide adenylyltransferase